MKGKSENEEKFLALRSNEIFDQTRLEMCSTVARIPRDIPNLFLIELRGVRVFLFTLWSVDGRKHLKEETSQKKILFLLPWHISRSHCAFDYFSHAVQSEVINFVN